jgi:hypothetical protein
MDNHIVDMTLALEREKAERAYLIRLLRFLLDEVEGAETDAEWAASVVSDGDFDATWQVLKDAEKDLGAMVTRMALHLRLERAERAAGGVK